jgi:hypothetical protein
VPEFVTYRRFCLLKRQSAKERCDLAIAGLWQWKQEQESGVSLPGDFPFLERLTADGYTTQEDFDGADEEEFTSLDYSLREARAILGALADL